MFDTLKFVRGAVSESHIVSVLTHFCVYAGRVQGQNGRTYIDAPCPEIKFEAIVPAERFLRAVDACENEPALRLTDAKRLIVSRDNFRAQLQTLESSVYPRGEPSQGVKTKLVPGLLGRLRQLRPFISDDAQRPWASTILFSGPNKAAVASNNAMIAMVDQNIFKGDVQIPIFCVDELLRIDIEPESYNMDTVSITFYYKGGAWLRSQLIVAEWPIKTAQDWLGKKATMKKLPPGIKGRVEELIPFCPDAKNPVIKFASGKITTLEGDSTAEINGIDVGEAAFHATNLVAMLSVADKIAIVEKAALFTGPNSFRGVMALLRL